MTSRLSPYTQRAMDLLADGYWHDEEAVVLEMIKLIPPGQAIRQAEKRRVGQSRRETSSPPKERAVPRSADYLRLVGGRAIALAALKNSVALERKSDENGRWVRIRPERRHPLAQQRIDRVWPRF